MAELGAESVSIEAITKRADLGVGTFYNYFNSRDDLVDAVIDDAVESLGTRMDAVTKHMDDPAEVVAVSVRHLMGTAVSDPVWGWLVVRLGLAHSKLIATMVPRATRDLKLGMDSGRFNIPYLEMAADIVFGALLSAIHTYLKSDRSRDPSVLLAEYYLRMLGMSPKQSAAVCARPLPRLPDLEEARRIGARESPAEKDSCNRPPKRRTPRSRQKQ
jgi:AcrR family transcriptional regulator